MAIEPPATTDTSTPTTDTSTVDDAPAMTDEGPALCEHIYDCGLVLTNVDGTVRSREQCASFRSTELSAEHYRCTSMPACGDMKACLGIPEEPPPPVCSDAFARALAVSPFWSGIWCTIDGEAVYDRRCLTASWRQSYNVQFAPSGDFLVDIITGRSGDSYDERWAQGHVAVGCQTVDVTQCGQVASGLPISFDGTYLRIGSNWALKAISAQFFPTPGTLCR